MRRRVELDPRELPDVVACLAIERPHPCIAWLDGDGSEPLGRRSYVGLGTTRAIGDWAALARTIDEAPIDAIDGELPRASFALAYDLGWSMPIGLRRAPRLDHTGPAAWWMEHAVTLVVDHATNETSVAGDAREIDRVLPLLHRAPRPRAKLGAIEASPRTDHRRAIERALEHIAEGDLYQVNLARRFTCTIDGSPLALALAMREASPVPLGAYLEGPPSGRATLISRSMERFLAFDARTRMLETRPIKGTRPRSDGDDEAARASLLADEKERAEHAMIVDLMRNDLGRVAEPGSVRVREAMRVEPYARLSHMVSIVEARARDTARRSEILEATFPPGSVTGAPKLAAIEEIEALEPHARGFYTGAIGQLARDGSFASSVAIRVAQLEGDRVRYFAGGGIVEASDPDRECDETELKARVLFDAARALEAD
jgi:anthranilate/para-aminobenzoate synthase component I